MQEGKNNNNNSKNNNSKNNLIGLAIFVGMFILIVIVIVILTKSILPSSGNSSSSMLVADSNLGIHTDTTTEPVSISTGKNSSSQISDNDSYDDYSNDNSRQGTKMTVKSSVNVRSGPGSENKQIGEIAAGTEITVYENKGGWYRISFNGSTDAYVYSDYVEGTLPESSSDSSDAYNANATTPSSANYAQYGQQNNFADTSDYNNEYYNN